MLTIRASQLDALRSDLLKRGIQDLLTRLPQAQAGVNAASVYALAMRFGVTALPDLPQFVGLVAEMGPELPRWVADTLSDPDVSLASHRLARVRDLQSREAALQLQNERAERLFRANTDGGFAHGARR